ncbi:MAG: phosphomannomutase/phosphoglucomutase [Candidatus Babeliales bacterium]
MQDSIFREYDIRGIVGKELDVERVYDLTRAILAYSALQDASIKKVAVGMDGRISSPAIKDQMVRALSDSGVEVTFIGICPSPVLYFALHQLKVDAGLMITASHNPKEYNGIKICLGKQSVWGKQIQEIKNIYQKQQFLPLQQLKGAVTEYSLTADYINWMVTHFLDLKDFKTPFIIDCGNGAGAAVIPELVKAMGWTQVISQCCTIDGTYPNHEADPTSPKNMQDVKALLATTNAQFGIGLDGDADRMGAMTKEGALVLGEQLLALFAQEVLKKHPESAVVFDVKMSQGLVDLITKWKGKPVMSPCGHALIKEQMTAHNAILGGELSCHFIFADDYFGYDDGIYALMRLLRIIKSSDKSLEQLVSIFPKRYSTHDVRIECEESQKKEIVAHIADELRKIPGIQLLTIDGVRLTCQDGWGIVRVSNTQPMINMRFESDTKEGLARIAEHVIMVIGPYFDEKKLRQLLGLS